MDNRLRRNELCVVGMPRCDYVFASTRSCFIGYGFTASSLEVAILKRLLADRLIEPVEAGGGTLAPGQNAFCAKICSKIITAQFCVVLLNEEPVGTAMAANPNVHMEYGLMLGFNKYVVPFQREGDSLPFNVAGLDTVKYTQANFEAKAAAALDTAVAATRPSGVASETTEQQLHTFLMTKRAVFSSVEDEGERQMFMLVNPLGYNLLHDFSGLKYIYFGNFAMLRPETILWRLTLLRDLIRERVGSIPQRIQAGAMTQTQADRVVAVFQELELWVLVSSEEDKSAVLGGANSIAGLPALTVFSLADVEAGIRQLSGS